MNTFLKSAIIYIELALFLMYLGVTAPAAVEYTYPENQNRIPTIIKNSFFSEVLYINNLNGVKEERSTQAKSGDLFLVNTLPAGKVKDCYIIIQNQLPIKSAASDFLLSSDLKSPPYNS